MNNLSFFLFNILEILFLCVFSRNRPNHKAVLRVYSGFCTQGSIMAGFREMYMVLGTELWLDLFSTLTAVLSLPECCISFYWLQTHFHSS